VGSGGGGALRGQGGGGGERVNGTASLGGGGDPFWTTAGGATHFLVLGNPLTPVSAILSVRLFDTSGNPQGSFLNRSIAPRGLLLLTIPTAFGLASPPTSGSVRITVSDGVVLRWYR